MTTAAVVPLKFYEVGKVHLKFWEQQVINVPLVVNLDAWNKLPPDIHLEKILDEFADRRAQAMSGTGET